MASKFNSLTWNPQIQNGKQNTFGVSSRKPLSLSIFGEREEDEDLDTKQASNGDGYEEDEFGEFESVSTAKHDQNGEKVFEKEMDNAFNPSSIQTQNVYGADINRNRIHENGNGIDFWDFGTFTSEHKVPGSDLLDFGGFVGNNGGSGDIKTFSNSFIDFGAVLLEPDKRNFRDSSLVNGNVNDGLGADLLLDEDGFEDLQRTKPEESSFGNLETVTAVERNPVESQEHHESPNSWELRPSTSEWMLAMHGIHKHQANGFKSSPEDLLNKKVSQSIEVNGGDGFFSQKSAEVTVQQSTETKVNTEDEWGDFVKPAMKYPEVQHSSIDMIDLISLSEETGISEVKQSTGADLLEDNKTGTDLLSEGLQVNSFGSLLDSHQDVTSSGVCEDLQLNTSGSLLDSHQGVTSSADIFSISGGILVEDEPLKQNKELNLFEDGDTGELLCFNISGRSPNGYARSYSLPLYDSPKPVVRSRSSIPSIDEWSFAGSVAAKPNDHSLVDLLETNDIHSTLSATEIDKAQPISLAKLLEMEDGVSILRVKKNEEDNLMSTMNLFDTNNGEFTLLEKQNEKDNLSNTISDLLALNWEIKEPIIHPAENEAKTEISDTRLMYIKGWNMLSSACSRELQLGSNIWHEASSSGYSKEIVSTEQGEKYFRALVQIYKVLLILTKTCEVYTSWLEPTVEHHAGLKETLEDSRKFWTRFEGVTHVLGSACVEDIRRFQESLSLIASSDALMEISRPVISHCALSLLPLKSLPDAPSVTWCENSYFLPVANLWANRVSSSPPL